GRQLGVTVLIDSGNGNEKLTELAKAGFLKPKRLVAVAEVTGAARADLEDLFEVDDYLALYNQAFGKALRAADLPSGERILERIKQKEGEFDTDRPADAIACSGCARLLSRQLLPCATAPGAFLPTRPQGPGSESEADPPHPTAPSR